MAFATACDSSGFGWTAIGPMPCSTVTHKHSTHALYTILVGRPVVFKLVAEIDIVLAFTEWATWGPCLVHEGVLGLEVLSRSIGLLQCRGSVRIGTLRNSCPLMLILGRWSPFVQVLLGGRLVSPHSAHSKSLFLQRSSCRRGALWGCLSQPEQCKILKIPSLNSATSM